MLRCATRQKAIDLLLSEAIICVRCAERLIELAWCTDMGVTSTVGVKVRLTNMGRGLICRPRGPSFTPRSSAESGRLVASVEQVLSSAQI